MKLSKIGAARANIVLLRETLRSVVDAVNSQATAQTNKVRKEIAYAEVVLKETGHAD